MGPDVALHAGNMSEGWRWLIVVIPVVISGVILLSAWWRANNLEANKLPRSEDAVVAEIEREFQSWVRALKIEFREGDLTISRLESEVGQYVKARDHQLGLGRWPHERIRDVTEIVRRIETGGKDAGHVA